MNIIKSKFTVFARYCCIFPIVFLLSCKSDSKIPDTKTDDTVKETQDKYYSLTLSTNNRNATNYSVNIDNVDKIKEGTEVTISNTPGYYKIVQFVDQNNEVLAEGNSFSFTMDSNKEIKIIFKYDIQYYIDTYKVKDDRGYANIILMAGQSNMKGEDSTYTSLSSEVRKYYTNNTDSVKFNSNVYSTMFTCNKSACGIFENVRFGTVPGDAFGPEIGFTKYLSTYDSTNNYYLIKVCQGGTNLAVEWNPDNINKIQPPSGNPKGTRYMYRNFVNCVNSCIDVFNRSNIKPIIKGMCWFQGEFDGENQSYANNYATNIRKLQNDIKTRYAEYISNDFKWISAGIATNSSPWPYATTVNEALRNNSDEYIQQTETLERITSAHYTAQSYLTIGQLFGMKYLGLNSTLEYTTPLE